MKSPLVLYLFFSTRYSQINADISCYARLGPAFFSLDRRWKEVCRRELIILPNVADQNKIHKYLYDVKKTWRSGDTRLLNGLAKKYKADGFIAGCTELHLHVRELISSGIQIIDPLSVLAQRIAESSFNRATPAGLSPKQHPRSGIGLKIVGRRDL